MDEVDSREINWTIVFTEAGTFNLEVNVSGYYNGNQSDPAEAHGSTTITVLDFEISVSPASQNIYPGQSTMYTVNITSINGFNSPVSLSLSDIPIDANYTFDPESVTPPSDGSVESTLQIFTESTVPPDTYNLTITGSSNDIIHSTSATLTVIDKIPPVVEVLSPENKTYATSSVPLTFTINEPSSWIGYSLDGQANVTISGNTTLTSLLDGPHNVWVYANDTAGNMGSSDVVHFTVREPTGTLTITTSPVAGEVFVDGVSWGIAPQSRVVHVGIYTISFGLVEGYATPSEEIATVYEDQETVVEGVYEEILPTKGALSVTTTPVSGEVFVNGSSWGLAPQSRDVDVGTYNVSFGSVADYYTPSWQLVTVSENVETSVTGVYTPIFGTLTVETSPVVGEVFVNETSWGVAPQSRAVQVGTYNVSFGHVAGYYTPTWQLATVQEDTETVVTGVYQPITGTLKITTTPVSGEVFVDGAPWGMSPQSRVVQIGTYNVSFGDVAGYYTPAWTPATVSENVQETVTGVYEPILGAIDGTVADASTSLPITGATVTADGYSATTNSTGYYIITDVPAGTYTVTAGATGYYGDTKTSIVVESGVTTINFTLSLIIGWIDGYVTDIDSGSAIVGATVAANDPSTTTDAVGYYKIELVPGDYTVTVSTSGYVDKSKTATVAAGETTIVNFTLASIPPTGTLSVTTTPGAGEVFVNGTSWGLAPQSRVVDVSTYNVSFGPVASYYTPAWQLVTVEENAETPVEGFYDGITGVLTITTAPVAAEVFVNGTSWGLAPQSRVIQIGTYIVTFSDVQGYYTPADQVTSAYEDVETSIEGVYESIAPLPTQLQVLAITSFVITTVILVSAIYIRRRKTSIDKSNQRP